MVILFEAIIERIAAEDKVPKLIKSPFVAFIVKLPELLEIVELVLLVMFFAVNEVVTPEIVPELTRLFKAVSEIEFAVIL